MNKYKITYDYGESTIHARSTVEARIKFQKKYDINPKTVRKL